MEYCSRRISRADTLATCDLHSEAGLQENGDSSSIRQVEKRAGKSQKHQVTMTTSASKNGFQFAIDRGGTFTDIYCRCPGGKEVVMKLLSVDPSNYSDAPMEGIRRILEQETGTPMPQSQPVDTSQIEWIRMGTTVATNALLERKGQRMALVITKGFRDLLYIGNQARPKIFDLEIVVPEGLYEEVIEVDERVIVHQDRCGLPIPPNTKVFTGTTSEKLLEWSSVDTAELRKDLQRVLDKGIKSLAVVLMHSYMFEDHEREVGDLALAMGFQHVSLSGSIMPMVKIVPRGYTACADAYLTPCIKSYVSSFSSGFKDNLKDKQVLFMSPSITVKKDIFANWSRWPFSRHEVSGVPCVLPMPTWCWARLLPDYFPKIFGKTEDQPLDMEASLQAFEGLTAQVNEFLASQSGDSKTDPMTPQEVAIGFIRVANETMCRPIRALTQARGHDTSRHILACFGGAGGQHACAIARSLGMSSVFIHRYSGILSAYGMALADVVHDIQEPSAQSYEQAAFELIDARIDELAQKCVKELEGQGFARDHIETEPFLHMRYDKTDCALMCSPAAYPAKDGTSRHGDFLAAFMARYKREFGFVIPERRIVIDDIRVRGVGKTFIDMDTKRSPSGAPPRVEKVVKCYFEEGQLDTTIYRLEELSCDHTIRGPAILIEKNSTILVEPNCVASITDNGDVKIQVGSGSSKVIGTELDTIQLSIFSHRFMSTAEQMGRVLQRTSISTNIKERLDFSCAMFGHDGGLVANAPHIPVHLGAMQETVQYQMRELGDDLKEGDVILTNHPVAGGSHLPDLTVITPVFYPGEPKPVFYVASRGHHADIGGTHPGSMPPHSKSIYEEGAIFMSFKLVKAGVFQEEAVTAELMKPAQYPGSSGTRNLHDNLSDLQAQVAANQKGIYLIKELIDQYSLPVVQAYMQHIQANAEVAVRDMMKEIGQKTLDSTGHTTLTAKDFLDDGSELALKINIDEEKGSAVFDFSGTSPEVYGNMNAPAAVTMSAIIYCLRCMVGHDIPLNQGCLKPIRAIIPKGTVLNPSPNAAVIGGNVETSQRIVDVILKAFQVCAASQGCMNNFTFGDDDVGYYETIAGGAGAGPTWHGRSGVHSHMTNTRITDPELFERRYPVILKQFQLNEGTGGDGRYRGGDGVIREIIFRRPLTISLLMERRAFRPYGMKGGCEGKPGKNFFTFANGHTINLGGKNSIKVNAGDVLKIRTPGGGGYGPPNGNHHDDDEENERPHKRSRQEGGGNQQFLERGSVYAYRLAQEQV
ncbi:5-oxoprolinase-like [Diadema antillarum]|uniref:5-oxoprolinase-like n=1 Tax=Diadema antillarum TaxID=105358 RepID=UPI003A8C43B9